VANAYTAPPMPYRFWSKVAKSDGCWTWTAYTTRDGYGVFGVEPRKTALAHRVAYEMERGPVPDGLELDHLCRNPRCVRPEHLEPVTHRENLLRGNGWSGRHARQTTCKRGHPFDVRNTYVTRSGGRSCRACGRSATARYLRRKRGVS
jgi:hypothetical protein